MVFNCKWVIKYALGFIAILKLDIRTYDVCETKPRTMNLAGFVSNSISDFSFIIVLNLSANVPCPHDVPTLLWTLQMIIVKQIRSDIFTSISIKITTVKSQVYFIYWIFHIQSSSGRINAIFTKNNLFECELVISMLPFKVSIQCIINRWNSMQKVICREPYFEFIPTYSRLNGAVDTHVIFIQRPAEWLWWVVMWCVGWNVK